MTLEITFDDLAVMCDAAEMAGEEVMKVYSGEFEVMRKLDHSFLTQADLRSELIIKEVLNKEFPEVSIISEESSVDQSVSMQHFFLVDPLDGTKEFVEKNDEFTVNIALVDGGFPVAGVVYAPALDELYYGAANLGVWRRQGSVLQKLDRIGRGVDTEMLRVVGSRSHNNHDLTEWLKSIEINYELSAVGSSLKFCRVACGDADLYPRIGPTSLWDTAAGQCILESAGGGVFDLTGAPLGYNVKKSIINPNFIALLDRGLLKKFIKC